MGIIDTAWINIPAIDHIQDSQVIPHGTRSPRLIYKINLACLQETPFSVMDSPTPSIAEKHLWAKSEQKHLTYLNCICDVRDSFASRTADPSSLDRRIEGAIKVAATRANLCKTYNPEKAYPGQVSRVATHYKELKQNIRHLFKIARDSTSEKQHRDNYLVAKKT